MEPGDITTDFLVYLGKIGLVRLSEDEFDEVITGYWESFG